MAKKKIEILLVDDHAVVRSGIKMIMASEQAIKIIGEAETGQEALDFVDERRPDVVIMDIGLGDMTGIEATKRITKKYPDIKVVALTINEDEEFFFSMLRAGASGYVPKRAAPEELVMAILAAANDEVYVYPSLAKILVQDYVEQGSSGEANSELTEREREVLSVVAQGYSNRDIGKDLHISPKTVARHRENIMRKLNLRNRTELVKYAIRKGIIEA